MAYERETYVNPMADAAGDGTTAALTGANCAFQSLNIWESTQQATITLIDDGVIVHCDSDDGESGHTADTTAVTVLGWDTDADSPITVQCDADKRSVAGWDATKYRLDVNGGTDGICDVQEDYVRYIGLQLNNSVSTTNKVTVYITNTTGGEIQISHCRIKSTETTNIKRVIKLVSATTLKLWNNFLYNASSSTQFTNNCIEISTGTIYAENNTCHGGHVGLYQTGGTLTPINNIIYNCHRVTPTFGTMTNPDYNSTDRPNDTGGANDLKDQTFTFEDAANMDYRLKAADAGAKDHGTNRSSTGPIQFSDDILGNERTGDWDIGGHEYIVAGVTVTPDAVTIVLAAADPTVVLGGITVTPSALSMVMAAANPAVVLGSITVTPNAVTIVMATADPTVQAGGTVVIPTPVSIVMATADPTIVGSIEAAIVAILTGDATVGGLVSDRVYANLAEQKPTKPYIVYQQISGIRNATMDGGLNLVDATFQVTCIAGTIEAVRALAKAVREVLNVYSGSAACTVIQAMFLQNESDIPDLAPGIEARRSYGKRLDFDVHYDEHVAQPTANIAGGTGSVEEALIAILTNDVPVSDLVSNRVYGNLADQDPTRPYIVYEQTGGVRQATMDGSLNLANASYQVTCTADTMEAARLLAEKVRRALNVCSGTAGGATIQAIFLQNESDNPDIAVGVEARRTYSKRLDFSIHHEE